MARHRLLPFFTAVLLFGGAYGYQGADEPGASTGEGISAGGSEDSLTGKLQFKPNYPNPF